MDYLTEPNGQLINNPDLHWIFQRWFHDTYGDEWFWQNTDFWMNFAVIGQDLCKLLAIVYDDNKQYNKVADKVGIYQIWQYRGGKEPKLLMPIHVADPTFFDQLKALVAEFTPLTTRDALMSNAPSLRETLQRTSDRPIPKFS